MVCKANPAAYVNIITPINLEGRRRRNRVNIAYSRYIIDINRKKKLAIPSNVVIIIFTHYNRHGSSAKNRFQSAGPSPKPDAQSPLQASPGSALFGGRLLRSSGLGPGQIRDAAPGAEGAGPRQRGGSRLW